MRDLAPPAPDNIWCCQCLFTVAQTGKQAINSLVGIVSCDVSGQGVTYYSALKRSSFRAMKIPLQFRSGVNGLHLVSTVLKFSPQFEVLRGQKLKHLERGIWGSD